MVLLSVSVWMMSCSVKELWGVGGLERRHTSAVHSSCLWSPEAPLGVTAACDSPLGAVARRRLPGVAESITRWRTVFTVLMSGALYGHMKGGQLSPRANYCFLVSFCPTSKQVKLHNKRTKKSCRSVLRFRASEFSRHLLSVISLCKTGCKQRISSVYCLLRD